MPQKIFDTAAERARSVWLLSFGDMTTLLITFFVMVLALNYSTISRVQKWVEGELDHAYEVLSQVVAEKQLDLIELYRDSQGILIRIKTDQAFASGAYEPTLALRYQLLEIGREFRYLRLFNEWEQPVGRVVLKDARAHHSRFQPEISVEGHTDSDSIAPWSPLKNNWILSALRAQSVMEQLVYASAMDPNWFSVTGYGDTRPLVPNDSPEHKAMNRRVEIRITAAFVSVEKHDVQ